MLNVNDLNNTEKDLLFALKKVTDIIESFDHDATLEYVEQFKKTLLNACDLMTSFNYNIFLFLDIDDVKRLLNMYINEDDYENRMLLSKIIITYIKNYYKKLYDYLLEKYN